MDKSNSSHTTKRSNNWTHDSTADYCTRCAARFNAINRRHHCRLCGKLFCGDCSSKKALIPPSAIVLTPKGEPRSNGVSFSPDEDPMGVLTVESVAGAGEEESSQNSVSDVSADVTGTSNAPSNKDNEGEESQAALDPLSPVADVDSNENVEDEVNTFNTELRTITLDDEKLANLIPAGVDTNNAYGITAANDESDPFRNVGMISSGLNTSMVSGKTVEERYKLAREPLRVCDSCCDELAVLQPELRASNANCVRFNTIDPSDVRRLFNSPLAFTLGHEIRKAAYTLNNLLPLPKRMGLGELPGDPTHFANISENCKSINPNLGDLDGTRIPAKLVERAKGLAILTTIRGGAGFGIEIGTGLAIARKPSGNWTAPSAIATVGVSFGPLIGATLTDHVFLLMTSQSVDVLFSKTGSLNLGADVAVAVGPVGRCVEADLNVGLEGGLGGIYTYSLSKGLYAGASFDGKIITTRHDVNEKFYGQKVSPNDIRSGEIPRPPAAQPLYDALKRCHVYARDNFSPGIRDSGSQNFERFGSTISTDDVMYEPDGDDCVQACPFPLPANTMTANNPQNSGQSLSGFSNGYDSSRYSSSTSRKSQDVEWPF